MDGLGTFHSLGGIKCVTPSEIVKMNKTIPRKNITIDNSKHEIPIHMYKKELNTDYEQVSIERIDINQNDCEAIKIRLQLDLVWLASFTNSNKIPSWNGFMQSMFKKTGI